MLYCSFKDCMLIFHPTLARIYKVHKSMDILETEYLDYPQRLERRKFWHSRMPDYLVMQGFPSTHMIFF